MKTIVFDFDGVINSYKSGWTQVDNIPDPPVEGIKELIDELRELKYKVIVSSARASDPRGKRAIEEYLIHHDIIVSEVTNKKPIALLYIDDRAITFDGNPKTLLKKILNFTPWYMKDTTIINGETGETEDLCATCIYKNNCQFIAKYGALSVKYCSIYLDESTMKVVEHSKWVYGGRSLHCERCGYEPNYSITKDNALFCNHCGARMDGSNGSVSLINGHID